MSQCAFRGLKQFTLLFFFAWAFVVFFANERQLVERFARKILNENRVTSERAQQAKEFFERHQKLNENANDNQPANTKDQEPNSSDKLLPAEVTEDKSQSETTKDQIIETPQIIKQPETAPVQTVIKTQQVPEEPDQASEPATEKPQKPEQVKETISAQVQKQQKPQRQQKKPEQDKKQKQVPKKPVQPQKAAKREQKKSEKQDKETKKEKTQPKQQKSEKPAREERQSQKTGKKGQKNKKE